MKEAEKEKLREAAIAQSEEWARRGNRFRIVKDDTGQRFIDYPEGRGFAPGYERNLENWQAE